MRIAVMDDNREEINQIQNLIFNIQGDYQVDQYLEGNSLIENTLGGARYDLFLCDIYMQKESGIDIAKRLLAIAPKTPIVFITSSREHAVEAYSLEALHYLVKPVSQDDIIEVFRRLQSKTQPRHTLTIHIDRAVNVLFQDEIIRVESRGHNTVITCVNNMVFSIRKPYRDISGMLDDTFIQVKQGVTLNMRWISRMTGRDCMTRDGYSYLLNRKRAREIRERYLSFVETELTKE